MPSDKIAVDIVIIPPEHIIKLAVELNGTLEGTESENYVLDRNTCIPHITLLMGLLERSRVPEANKKLLSIAGRFSAINLRISRGHVSKRPDTKSISSLEIEKNKELQRLHETVVAEMRPLLTYEGVREEMFYSLPPVNQVPMYWVKGFAETSVLENYWPHLTLGVGELSAEIEPQDFEATKIALCHLGNYCTCRKLLWSTELKTQ